MIEQFLNTLHQIIHSDSVGPIRGTYRHLQWQGRKLLGRFPCELPIGGSRLFVDHANSVAALVNAMDLYDFNNMSLLRIVSRLGGVFVDVGANVGSYTLIASESALCKVVSIEPHPRAFALLAENVKRNHRPNVTCLAVAISDADGWCSLTDGAELCMNRIVSSDNPGRAIRVKVRTLRSVCEELGIVPDFIKIDVEGFEPHVLDGLGRMAAAAKIMWIEHGDDGSIRKKMQAAGYSGPYYVHYRTLRLDQTRANRPEDPVFVRHDYIGSLEGAGFQVDHCGTEPGPPHA